MTGAQRRDRTVRKDLSSTCYNLVGDRTCRSDRQPPEQSR